MSKKNYFPPAIPTVAYTGIRAAIDVLTGLDDGCIAMTTDAPISFGFFDGTAWVWMTPVSYNDEGIYYDDELVYL